MKSLHYEKYPQTCLLVGGDFRSFSSILFFYHNHSVHTIVCEGIEGGNNYGEKTVDNARGFYFPGDAGVPTGVESFK